MDEAALRRPFEVLLRSYSQIFFSENLLTGALLAAATFVHPVHGIFGLLGAGVASASAWLIGLDRGLVRNGVYGFNGVLLGLAVGSSYALTPACVLVLAIACIGMTFLTAGMSYALGYYFGLPAISLPFTFVTWGVVLACVQIGILHPALGSGPPIVSISIPHPGAGLFLSSLGAILFEPNALAGALAGAGLLVHSRIAAVLAAIGLAAAHGVQVGFVMDPRVMSGGYFGFNAMLSCLAIGGVYLVPGPASVLLGVSTAVFSMAFVLMMLSALPGHISPLALPFNAAVLLVLLGLRLRANPSEAIRLAPAGAASPERMLDQLRRDTRVARARAVAISLPFLGRWKVTQGINGRYTHQGIYRFAYDFELTDGEGRTYRGQGLAREDYLCYGKPVIAPADGRVVSIENAVPDNPIGVSNLEKPWGNYVIIEHAPGWFSCLAHFRPGSIQVSPGQWIARGQKLGLCGNSGRSPYPHIHFHVQEAPGIGAPTVPFSLNCVLICGQRGLPELRPRLREGMFAQNVQPLDDFFSFFHPCQDVETKYLFEGRGESWRMKIDPQGNRFIESAPLRTRMYFRAAHGKIALERLEGSRKTGLFQLASVLTEIALVDASEPIEWDAEESAREWVHPVLLYPLELLQLFGVSLLRLQNYRLSADSGAARIQCLSELALRFMNRSHRILTLSSTELVLRRYAGVTLTKQGCEILKERKNP